MPVSDSEKRLYLLWGCVLVGLASIAFDLYYCLHGVVNLTGLYIWECTFWPVAGKGLLLFLCASGIQNAMKGKAHKAWIGVIFALLILALLDSAFEWGGKDVLFAIMENMDTDD